MANVLGRLDPKTGKIKEYQLKTPHSGPHGLLDDKDGNIWYTGNAGLIGKLDPKTGDVTEYPMPDPQARDPHTLDLRPERHPVVHRAGRQHDRPARPEDAARSSWSRRPRRSRTPTAWWSIRRAFRVLRRVRRQQDRQHRSADDGNSRVPSAECGEPAAAHCHHERRHRLVLRLFARLSRPVSIPRPAR